MALTEDIIFADPVLQQIFFDKRRFAPRSDYSSSQIAGLETAISEDKVQFQRAKTPALAEYWQRKMRARWFVIRNLADGYFIDWPADYSADCECVKQFAHENSDKCFQVDFKARAAIWYRYGRRAPPEWRAARRRSRGRHRPL